MKHRLYEIFRHPAPFKGLNWAVQMNRGILCFRTKRQAQTFVDVMIMKVN